MSTPKLPTGDLILLFITEPKCFKINVKVLQPTFVYFDFNDLVVVYNTKTLLENQPIVIQNSATGTSFNYRKAKHFLINLENSFDFAKVLLNISLQETFNPRAKTIVTLPVIYEEIFQKLARYYIYNVVVFEVTTQKIYGYFPFTQQNAHEFSTDYLEVNQCENGKLQHGRNLFPSKLPKTWSNTTLNIAYVIVPPFVICPDCPMPGLEIHLIKQLQTILSFAVNYTQFTRWGNKNAKDGYSFAFLGIFNRTVNTGIGHFRGRSIEYQDFDMTFAFSEEFLTWIVPKSNEQEYWERFTFIYSASTWLLTLGTLICESVFFWVFSRATYKNFTNALFHTYQIFVGISTRIIPTPMKFRLVFVSWCLFQVVFWNGFSSNLIVVLTEDSYKHQVSTVQEITQNKFKINLNMGHLILFEQRTSAVDNYIMDNYDICYGLACYEQVARGHTVAAPIGKKIAKYYTPMYFTDSRGQPTVYRFKEHYIYMFLVNWFFYKGFPMFEQINDLLFKFKVNGMINNANSIYDNFMKLRKNSLGRVFKKTMKTRRLSFKHLEGAFFLLFMGWLLGLTALIFEKFCRKFNKKKTICK